MINFLLIFSFFYFSIYKFFSKCELICPPDNFIYEEFYKDYTEKKLSGFIFKKVLRDNYNDYWRGFVWDKDNFCYKPYNNNVNKIENYELEEIGSDPIKIYNKKDNKNPIDIKYVIIDEEKSNLKKFYLYGCETDESYQILFKMDEPIEKFDEYYFLNFIILNPYSTNVRFKFKTHTFNTSKIKKIRTIACKEEESPDPTEPSDPTEPTDPTEPSDPPEPTETSEPTETPEECNQEYEEEVVEDVYMDLNDNVEIPEHSMKLVQIPIKIKNEKNSSLDNKEFFYKISNEYIEGLSQNYYNFFYNQLNITNENVFDVYKTFTQLEIILEANDSLYVSSYSMTYERKNEKELKYNGDDKPSSLNNCSKGQVCIEHYGCSNDVCKQCNDIACEKCLAPNQCVKCFAIAENWKGLNPPGNCNNLNFIDLTKFSMNDKNIVIEKVPPAYHYRVTMEFWIYINSIELMDKFMNIIFKDFMAISIQKLDENNLEVYCVPFEFLYNYPDDETYYDNNTINNITKLLDEKLGAFYVKKTFENIPSKWINIRCAYNIENSKMIINEDEYVMKIPQFYEDQTNIPFYLKKFYKENEYTKIIFQRFLEQNKTFIYFRNLNIFREFIPYSIVTKYLNLHKFSSYKEFPQLLFSIPFDEVISTSSKTYKFKTYNFFDDSINETNTLTTKEDNLQPPRNFYRLNLLEPNNSQYSSCDLDEQTTNIQCFSNEYKCFDDNLYYVCKKNVDKPIYLNPINLTCQNGCPYNYMIYPRDNEYNQSQICNKECDSNTNQCASSDNNYYNISEGFICGNGYFNLYYKCYDIQDSINDVDNAGIYFGGLLNSHSIVIDLNNEYKYFAISMWIFPAFHLRNYRYIEEQTPNNFENWENKYIFLSNDLKIYYKLYNDIYIRRNSGGSFYIYGNFQTQNWNHLLITVEKNGDSQSIYGNFINNWFLYDYGFFGYSANGITLKKILFCIKDISIEGCSNIEWIDAFYRKIQIFDITYSNKFSMFFLSQFENEKNYMLKHMFIHRMSSITNNRLYDELNNSIYGIVSNQYLHNPDNTNYFNYVSNYFPDRAFNDSSLYVSSFTINKSIAKLITGQNNNCEIALSGRCLSCKNNYSLWGNGGCYSYEENVSSYTYKNPGVNQPNKLYLKINYESFKDSPSLTLFFFIKLYSFRDDIDDNKEEYGKILIFDEANNFYLAFDIEDESLNFYYNNEIIFKYSNFRKQNFGFWIPISIAAFRESDRTFQLNMLSASIKNTNLDYKFNSSSLEFYKVDFKEFIITNNWVGLLSDIKIYDRFMVNAWGIIKNNLYESDFPPIFALSLKSSSKINCFSQDLLLYSPGSSYEYRCVMDYNNHFPICSPHTSQYLNDYMGFSDIKKCEGTCGSGYAPAMCLGNYNTQSSTWNLENKSCESKKLLFSNFYLSLSNNKIRCISINSINYARFKSVNIMVNSPTLEWNLEFWFYTDSFRNSYNSDTITLTNNKKKNNFDNIVFEWDYHNKIIVKSIDNSNNLYITCVPLINKFDSNQDSKTNITFSADYNMGNWKYISCGVDYVTEKSILYQGNTYRVSSREINFEKTISTIPSSLVDFYLNENSPNGYGLTLIRELKLWQCYNCNVANRNFGYEKDNPIFTNLIHNFNGYSSSYTGGKSFSDELNNELSIIIPQVSNYIGENILEAPGGFMQCEENYFQYYNEKDTKCFHLLNMNKVNDISISLPSTRTGRYTMEFWTNIEIVSQLTLGINFYWEKHLSITLITDNTQSSVLNVICFPQAYIDNVDGLESLEIYELLEKSTNSQKLGLVDVSNKWIFVRCAVDMTRKIFYINDPDDNDTLTTHNYKTLKSEILYGNTRNYRPFRLFSMPIETTFKIQNHNKVNTRVFLRQLRIYREFIDMNIDNIKYINLQNTEYLTNFKILELLIDFGLNTGATYPCGLGSLSYINCQNFCNNNDYCGLYYYIINENGSYSKIHKPYWINTTHKTYASYPENLYNPNFCEGGQKGGNEESCSGTARLWGYYNSSNEYFYPSESGKFLNLENRIMTDNCGNSNYGKCRLTDLMEDRTYCLFNTNDNNLESCASSITDSKFKYYDQNFKCPNGFTKVYYECINNDIIENSALYFSNKYSFNNLVFETNDDSIDNYFLEFWIKFDLIHTPTTITEDEYYFYGFPHIIVRDYTDNKYKYYNGVVASDKRYELITLSKYEWNRIIIENSHDDFNHIYNIKFFTNYDFENPEVTINNLDDTTYKLFLRGFVFCDQNNAFCTVKGDPVYLHWGIAYYRNIRVWDASLSNVYSIQYNYNDIIESQIFYFKFTIDTIEKNTVVDIIDPSNKFMHKWLYSDLNYDNDYRINYSTDNFDYTFINSNHFITSLNANGTDYLINECHSSCRRCYSADSNNCYECRDGFILSGKKCNRITGYYFKTPTLNSDLEFIKLNSSFINLTKIH